MHLQISICMCMYLSAMQMECDYKYLCVYIIVYAHVCVFPLTVCIATTCIYCLYMCLYEHP